MARHRPPSAPPPTTPRSPSDADGRSGTRWLIGGLVVAVAVVVGLVVALTGGDDDGSTSEGDTAASTEFQPVSVTGTLPGLESGVEDEGGADAPVATVHSFDGAESVLPVAGQPTMIAFGAHWCPHCQRTFPVIVDWMAEGGADGVQVVAVATGTRADADNYPPSAWLEEIDWAGGAVADDEESTLATAYGLGSYPYLVFVDADGVVQHRVAGEVTPEQLDEGIASIT